MSKNIKDGIRRDANELARECGMRGKGRAAADVLNRAADGTISLSALPNYLDADVRSAVRSLVSVAEQVCTSAERASILRDAAAEAKNAEDSLYWASY